MSATVRVAVGWDHENERFYFDRIEPGETDDETHRQEGDVPAALWEQYEEAFRTLASCETAMRAQIDVAEGGTRRQPCDDYHGDEPYTAPPWFAVQVPASGDEDTFPIRPVRLGFHVESMEAARAYLAELPEDLWLIVNGHPVRVLRSDLEVFEAPGWTSTPDCERCGWPRSAHREGTPSDRPDGGS